MLGLWNTSHHTFKRISARDLNITHLEIPILWPLGPKFQVPPCHTRIQNLAQLSRRAREVPPRSLGKFLVLPGCSPQLLLANGCCSRNTAGAAAVASTWRVLFRGHHQKVGWCFAAASPLQSSNPSPFW